MHSLLFLSVFTLSSFLGSSCLAQEDGSLDINSELVEILDTFEPSEGYDPNSTPKLEDLLDAKGTLVFFDNTDSTGEKAKVNTPTRTGGGILEKTLAKARRRLLGSKPMNQEQYRPIFSDRNATQTTPDFNHTAETSNAPFKYMKIKFDGKKTSALILPNILVEVPFYKHIPYFFSHIELLSNGSVKVTETIERVVEEGETDFYGINRHFPKYHYDRIKQKRRTNLTVLESFIDNIPASTQLLPEKEGMRVYLHSQEPLKAGTHLFSITYLFANRIAEFENSDKTAEASHFKEFIWDVTGNEWDVPITRAAAAVIFPASSHLYSQAAITSGPEGFGHNYRITKDKENNLSYVLTFPLAPHEGLTILANWAETLPAPVFQNGKVDKFIQEHGLITVSLISFLFVLSYYLTTYFSLKKNNTSSTVRAAPLQKGDISAVVLNYALSKKINNNSLFIILTSMASKSFLCFDEKKDGTVLLVKQTDKMTTLSSLEKKIARKLFSKESTSFALTNANLLRLTRVMTDIEKSLKKEYRKNFTTFPQSYFFFGILMAFVAVGAVTSLSLFPLLTALTSFGCILFSIPCAVLIGKFSSVLKNKTYKKDKITLAKLTVFTVPFAFILGVLFVYYSRQTTVPTTIFFFAILATIGVFRVLLRSPSVLGKSLLENMEGYKLYLSSQDDTLLSVMRNAEEKIKSLYSKHLPFALALNVADLWTQRFVAFSQHENELKPNWYKGQLNFDENFIKSLQTQFAKIFVSKETNNKKKTHSRFKKKAS